MSYAMGLGATLRALSVARMGIQTASQNVANANVPGYSRQRMLTSSTSPINIQGMLIGSGVQVRDIRRIVDDGLITRLLAHQSLQGSAGARYERMREIETLFSDVGGGPAEYLSQLFGTLGELQSDPGDRALRGAVVQAGQNYTSGLNLLGDKLAATTGDIFGEVRGLAHAVEEQARIVAELNGEIARLESGGSTANDLRDRRDQAVRELGQFVDVRVVEHTSGSTDLIVGGRLLVAGRRSEPVDVMRDAQGHTRLTIGANRRVANVEGGRIGAMLEIEQGIAPDYLQRLDRFVRDSALAFDRIHTTGVPGNGPLQNLVAGHGVTDTNNNGVLGDELLESAGLPFEVGHGELWIRITNRATGDHDHHKIDIDPTSTTLFELAEQLDGVPHLQASVDSSGHLRMQADGGFGFDFAPVLDRQPDPLGLFGSASPTVAAASAGPFDLAAAGFPQTFTVDVDGTLEAVSLTASDFADPSRATATELAAAINADLTKAEAFVAPDGRLTLRATSSGAGATMTLADGAGGPLAALGLPTGSFAGQALGVQTEIGGSYSGTQNQQITFRALGDGEIGVTPGLQIGAFDAHGRQTATLDVGDGYDGGELPVGNGVTVKFSHGHIEQSAGDGFAVDLLADPDTSDLLVALGLNSFFLDANSAATIRMNPTLVADPGLLATAREAGSGGTGNLLAFAALENSPLNALDGDSPAQFIAGLVADVGFETSRARSTLDTQEVLGAALEEQRLSISGVDLDEEMLDLVAWQQAYEAASRLVAVVQEMTDTLMNLGRT